MVRTRHISDQTEHERRCLWGFLNTSCAYWTYWKSTHVRHFKALRLRVTKPGAVQVLKWEKAFRPHSSTEDASSTCETSHFTSGSTGRRTGFHSAGSDSGSTAPACGLLRVRPWHRRCRAPPLREFNARLLWSAAALSNVSCVLETHTRASGRERPPHLDYVFDQHKNVEELKERAHGKAWRNESLLCQDLHNFIDVLHGDKQLQVGRALPFCFFCTTF